MGGTKTTVSSRHTNQTFPTDLSALPNALHVLSRRGPAFDVMLVGIRGVWTPAEKATWKKKLAGIAAKITVISDIELAHRVAFGPKGAGILLNAGTGSIALGRNAQGTLARAGGLGALIGDEGSAFWIGKIWLKERFERDGDWKKLRTFVKRPEPVRAIAALAKPVLAKAATGRSSIEKMIAVEAATHLAELVAEVRRQLHVTPSTPLHLSGGLFNNDWFRKEVLRLSYSANARFSERNARRLRSLTSL